MENEFTADEYIKLWDEIILIKPKKVVFTGGEPLSRPDIFELLKSFNSLDYLHSIKRSINITGTGLNEEKAALLANLVDEVNISFGGIKSIHDEIRGKGTFDIAIKALRLLRNKKIKTVSKITLTSKSMDGLNELITILSGEGINHVSIHPILPVGRALNNLSLLLSEEQNSRFFNFTYQNDISKKPNCGVGKYVNILPNGDVYPCHTLIHVSFKLGNIRITPLTQICQSSGLLGRLRNLNFKELENKDPFFLKLANGACLGVFYEHTKDSGKWNRILNNKHQMTIK